MNIALFGGTFDPVHCGHLAVARAAAKRFRLGRIYFVPADLPPHKQRNPITPYAHRYAMLALATAGEKGFLPSLMEANSGAGPSYSIYTVRRFKRSLAKGDRLFFVIGMDAFLEIATWHQAEALLRECDFIVASRPGFSLADVAKALPEGLRQKVTEPPERGKIVLGKTAVYLLDGVRERVSATEVRKAAERGRSLKGLVEPSVAQYIRKMGLYRD